MLLLGARETTLASCAYGSVHEKEFGLLGANMKVELLHRKCPRNHSHIRIQGKYTKPSATYCPGLALALAVFFYDHLKAFSVARERLELQGLGLDDVLSNELAIAADWKIEDAWSWRAPAHINVLETAATLKMLRREARQGGDQRVVYLVDSHVSRSIVSKGSSSSNALRGLSRQLPRLSGFWTLPCWSLRPNSVQSSRSSHQRHTFCLLRFMPPLTFGLLPLWALRVWLRLLTLSVGLRILSCFWT